MAIGGDAARSHVGIGSRAIGAGNRGGVEAHNVRNPLFAIVHVVLEVVSNSLFLFAGINLLQCVIIAVPSAGYAVDRLLARLVLLAVEQDFRIERRVVVHHTPHAVVVHHVDVVGHLWCDVEVYAITHHRACGTGIGCALQCAVCPHGHLGILNFLEVGTVSVRLVGLAVEECGDYGHVGADLPVERGVDVGQCNRATLGVDGHRADAVGQAAVAAQAVQQVLTTVVEVLGLANLLGIAGGIVLEAHHVVLHQVGCRLVEGLEGHLVVRRCLQAVIVVAVNLVEGVAHAVNLEVGLVDRHVDGIAVIRVVLLEVVSVRGALLVVFGRGREAVDNNDVGIGITCATAAGHGLLVVEEQVGVLSVGNVVDGVVIARGARLRKLKRCNHLLVAVGIGAGDVVGQHVVLY